MQTTTTRRQNLSKWILIFAGWTFLAFLFSGPQMIQALRLNRAEEGWKSVVGELIFSYLWFALTPFVIWLSKSFRIEGGQPRLHGNGHERHRERIRSLPSWRPRLSFWRVVYQADRQGCYQRRLPGVHWWRISERH